MDAFFSKLQPSCTVQFDGNDDNHTLDVTAVDLTVIPSAGDHIAGSSKIKLRNIVDYTWEDRFYTGQLLAVHMDGKYLAYGICAGKASGGVVRVLNIESSGRTLIKGMDGMVQDVAFAFIPHEILLACVDQSGNLFVHKVTDDPSSGLLSSLVIHIIPNEEMESPLPPHRVVWCPYIPEDGNRTSEGYDEVAGLLALTRGVKIELWNIPMVKRFHGSGPLKPNMVVDGFLEVDEHTEMIVDAAFSPDGTAIATVSLDGEIKFFQVYMQNATNPRCLHQWKPHGGKPLSCLFFLDNHKNYNPEAQFWKFAITGGSGNSEIKLWSCESWKCLQTIRFTPKDEERTFQMKAAMDLDSNYLVLTDQLHRVLFVVNIQKDDTETNCYLRTISEFPLLYSVLSLGIADAGVQQIKSDSVILEELCNGDEEEAKKMAVVVRMYIMQPKSLHECVITYIPTAKNSITNGSAEKFQNATGFPEKLPDVFQELADGSTPLLPSSPKLNLNDSMSSNSSLQLNLMTPAAFNSPAKHESPSSTAVVTDSKVVVEEEEEFNDALIPKTQPDLPDSSQVEALVGFASGGSSPSREVQKILSQKYYEKERSEEPPETNEVVHFFPTDKNIVTYLSENLPPIPKDNLVVDDQEQIVDRNSNSQLHVDTIEMDNSVSQNLAVIQQMLKKQEEEIKLLKENLQRHQNIKDLEKSISQQIEKQNMIIKNAITSNDTANNQEVLLSAISQTVNNLISTKLDDIVSSEINNSILPVILETLEALKQDIHVEMTKKLSATDHLLKDNIYKLINSKALMEVLNNALVTALKPCLSDVCKEMFLNFALPQYEKTCAVMFNNINDAFSRGVKEYIQVLKDVTENLNEKSINSNEQIKSCVDLIKTSSKQVCTDVSKVINSIDKRMDEALRAQQNVLEGSVLAAVRSGALTPAPDSKEAAETQILNLIQGGHYNTAFQQALSASDLNLVLFACKHTRIDQLFKDDCPLPQHVLLSLIQQLSADFNANTDLKLKFLEEAVIFLDINNPNTREHMPIVLNNLRLQISRFINSNPAHQLARRMKVLNMASQSLLSA